MSLYSEYISEKVNKFILETDKGFATYSFTDDKTIYIEDIYICPRFRCSNEASNMANKIVELAKERGCTKLLGSVIPSTNNSTDSIHVLIHYGMKLESSTNNFILFSKEI